MPLIQDVKRDSEWGNGEVLSRVAGCSVAEAVDRFQSCRLAGSDLKAPRPRKHGESSGAEARAAARAAGAAARAAGAAAAGAAAAGGAATAE